MSVAAVVPPYYKEQKTNDYLSKTFESSLQHAPGHTERRTVSEENYQRSRSQEPVEFKTPWGRKYSYGGVAVLQLPTEHRPKGEPPLRMSKGAAHYGSGLVAEPSGRTVQRYYDSVSLGRRARTRGTDELIPRPTEVDVSKQRIDLNFPVEDVYATHTSRNDLFPNGETTDNRMPISAATPALPPDVGIKEKPRGSYGRHEVISIPLNSHRKPMTWPGSQTHFKILKGINREKQVYYPVPTNQNNATLYYPRHMYPNTARALKELKQSQLQTTYQRDFDRNDKPYLNLDDENTLVKITAGPNATVPKTLMYSASREDKEGRTVEEISGEIDRKNRCVHFEQLHEHIENESNRNEINQIKDQNTRTFIRPTAQQVRPLTAAVLSHSEQIPVPERQTKSAFDRTKSSNEVSTHQNWSKSDYMRKFNVIYRNKEETDLRLSRKGDRRHHIPEANYVLSSVFS